MTLAYQRGYAEGLKRKSPGACPYRGNNDGSMALQIEWMAGHFDAITGRRLPRKRKNLRPRRPHARVRWPKSLYARRRLESLIGEARA